MPPEQRPTVLGQGGQVPGGTPSMPPGTEQPPGMGEGPPSPEEIKQFILQQLQQAPPEKLVEIAQNPQGPMKAMFETISQVIPDPNIAMQIVQDVFAEIFTMAQVQSNQTYGMLNPEHMEAPPEPQGQGGMPQPQGQGMPEQRPTVLGGQ